METTYDIWCGAEDSVGTPNTTAATEVNDVTTAPTGTHEFELDCDAAGGACPGDSIFDSTVYTTGDWFACNVTDGSLTSLTASGVAEWSTANGQLTCEVLDESAGTPYADETFNFVLSTCSIGAAIQAPIAEPLVEPLQNPFSGDCE